MSGWKLRNAGSRWRLLVHKRAPGTRMSRSAYDIRSNIPYSHDAGEYESYLPLDNTEFDELVVGQWAHIEQMDTNYWWMNIGGVTVHVRADRDGRPKSVSVNGPGDYADAVDGCVYQCVWSAGSVSDSEATDGGAHFDRFEMGPPIS